MVDPTAERMRQVFRALSLLRPYDLVLGDKYRVGRAGDGGYVLVRPPSVPPIAYCFGVGDEISFEFSLAQEGTKAYMHDHTVAGLPYEHPNLHFFKEGVSASDTDHPHMASIATYIHRNGDDGRRDLLLKLDVEGAEYDVLATISIETLTSFQQIALELHWLTRLSDDDFRTKFIACLELLNEHFTLCHVHANNCAPIAVVEGFTIADVLELTYVRNDLVVRTPSQTFYPTALDCANDPDRADLPLLFFPFLPMSVSEQDQLENEIVDKAVSALDYDYKLRSTTELSPHERKASLFNRKIGVLSRGFGAPQHRASPVATGSRRYNILYLACHETLEYDDVRMFTEMGHRVFSVGGLANPNGPKPATRPTMDQFYSQQLWDAFVSQAENNLVSKRITPSFARLFDVVIVNHDPAWLDLNADSFAGIPIVFRSIGQSNHHHEAILARHADRVTIVRYSSREAGLPGFCRTDRVIYFSKFLSDYPKWEPGNRAVTFHNSFPTRGSVSVPSLAQYEDIARAGPYDLYGFLNEGVDAWRGLAPADMQLELYRTSGIYFYVYSAPPSYTLSFVEAMLVGAPVVAPSARAIHSILGEIAEATCFWTARYEIADMLDNDPALLWDTIEEAIEKTDALMSNQEKCREVSNRLRAKGAAMFDVRAIIPQWQDLLSQMIS